MNIFHLLFHEHYRKPSLVRAVVHLEPALKTLEGILRTYPKKIELIQRLNAKIDGKKDTILINKLIRNIYLLDKKENYDKTKESIAIKQLLQSFSNYYEELGGSEEVQMLVNFLYRLDVSLEDQYLWVIQNYANLFVDVEELEQRRLKLNPELKDSLKYFETLVKEEGNILFGADKSKGFADFVKELETVLLTDDFKRKLRIPKKVGGKFLTLYHYTTQKKGEFLKKGDILRGTEGEEGFYATFDLKELNEAFEEDIISGKPPVLIRVKVAEKIADDLFVTYSTERFKHAVKIPVKRYYLANKHIIAGNLYFEIC